jgi:HEAT repeat protein
VLDSSKNLATGSKIFVIGTPLGFLENTISEGIVSGKRNLSSVRLLQITAPVSPGSSGSPVISSTGKVVGVVSFRLNAGESLNFATSAADVSKVIQSSGNKKPIYNEPFIWVPIKEPPVPKLIVPNGNPRLLALAKKLSDPKSANEAARKLRLEGSKALPYLYAALPLQESGNPDDGPSPSEKRVINVIASNGAAAIPFAINQLGKGYSNNYNYIAILELLGPPVAPAMCQKLQSPDYMVRRDAALILSSSGNKIAVPHLLQALRDSDVIVRANAAGALGRLGDSTGLSVLSELLKDSRLHVRDHAVSRLGLLNTSESVAILENLAWDLNRQVSLYAVSSALRVVGERGFVVLIRMLGAEEHEVRHFALWQFWDSKNKSCAPHLIPVLMDPVPWMRGTSAEMLGEFKAVFAVPALVEALSDSDPAVRKTVVLSLGQIGSKSAVDPLLNLFLNESNEDVMEAIRTALGKLGVENVIQGRSMG